MHTIQRCCTSYLQPTTGSREAAEANATPKGSVEVTRAARGDAHNAGEEYSNAHAHAHAHAQAHAHAHAHAACRMSRFTCACACACTMRTRVHAHVT